MTYHSLGLTVVVDPRDYPDLLAVKAERDWLVRQITDLKFEETVTEYGAQAIASTVIAPR